MNGNAQKTVSSIRYLSNNTQDAVETLDVARMGLSNISEISLNEFKNIRILKAAHNKITEISRCAFGGLENIEKLALGYNLIKEIDEDAFSGEKKSSLPTLKKLYVPHNYIKELKSKSFETLSGLEEIILKYNYISELPNGLFSKNKNLKTVDFENNRIKIIGNAVFVLSSTTLRLNLTKNDCIDKSFYLNVNNVSSPIISNCNPLEKLKIYNEAYITKFTNSANIEDCKNYESDENVQILCKNIAIAIKNNKISNFEATEENINKILSNLEDLEINCQKDSPTILHLCEILNETQKTITSYRLYFVIILILFLIHLGISLILYFKFFKLIKTVQNFNISLNANPRSTKPPQSLPVQHPEINKGKNSKRATISHLPIQQAPKTQEELIYVELDLPKQPSGRNNIIVNESSDYATIQSIVQ